MCEQKTLIVTQDATGRFACGLGASPGTCIVGYGASVLEAVGEWVIQSQMVDIRCEPPAVLREYSVSNDYQDLKFTKSPSRGD